VGRKDRDAIWKPGYAGEVVYHRATTSVTRSRRRRRLVIGFGLSAAVAMSVLIVPRLIAGRDAATSTELDRIPTHIRERWRATLDGPVAAVAGTDDVVVAWAGTELVAFDARSGSERWRVPAPSGVGEIEVIRGVVVFHDVSGRAQLLAGFDLHDGHRLWSRMLPQGPQARLAADGVVLTGFTGGGLVNSLQLVDPRTGIRLAALEGDEITLSSTTVRRRVGDVVEWYDRGTFDVRDRVDLSTLALDRFHTAAVATDAGLVVAAFDRAWLLDGHGTVLSAVSFSQQLDAPWGVDELDGSGHRLVLQGVNATTLLTVDDGTLHEEWTRPVAPVDWMIDYSRTMFAIRQRNDDETGLRVVGAATGRAIFSGQHPGLHGPALGSNGFVAGTDPTEDGSWSVVGYDFSGHELWRLPVPSSGWPILLPGALLTVSQAGDAPAATLTLRS
jgi:hypothetical protein